MKYPIFLNLKSKRVVVVGAGSVGTRKVLSLLDSQARIVVIADDIDKALETQCIGKNVEFVKTKYSKEYLAGAVIAFAATNNSELNRQIYKDCQELEILCNVPENPELSDFLLPAVVKRGGLQITVGTEGSNRAYEGHIRKKLEEIFTDKHGEFLAELDAVRQHISSTIADPEKRIVILGELAGDSSFQYFLDNSHEKWQKYIKERIKTHTAKE